MIIIHIYFFVLCLAGSEAHPICDMYHRDRTGFPVPCAAKLHRPTVQRNFHGPVAEHEKALNQHGVIYGLFLPYYAFVFPCYVFAHPYVSSSSLQATDVPTVRLCSAREIDR